MTLEGGKPLVENSDEVGWTAAAFDYYAEIGRELRRPGDPADRVDAARARAEGADRASSAASCPGTTRCCCWPGSSRPRSRPATRVVCKPSRADAALDADAGAAASSTCPPGVVNILAGAGDVGEAIVRDERVDCVAFTGSVETGKKVAARCAERVARVNLEMGGKDPFIVCADVAGRIEVAAKGGAWAAFLNAGQVCTSAERFYVMEQVYDDYVREFVDYTGACVVGDPLDPATDVGPMVSAAPARQGRGPGRGRGRRGRRARDRRDTGGHGTGHFFSPAVVTGAAGRDRPAARGDVRPGRADRPGRARSTRRSSSRTHALRPRLQRLHARPEDDPALHARDQGRHRLVQRPADRQRRRPVRRHEAVRPRPRARARKAWRPSRRPSTSTSRRRSRRKDWWYPYGGGAEQPTGA